MNYCNGFSYEDKYTYNCVVGNVVGFWRFLKGVKRGVCRRTPDRI